MKPSIEKIRNCNSVIQFIILILLSAFLLMQGIVFIGNQFPGQHNSGVQIITKQSKADIKKTMKYTALLRDTYVFSLESNAISDTGAVSLQKSVASYDRTSVGGEIVNFYFISDTTKKETQLFEKNTLIASHQFINDSKANGFILDKNIYAVVAQDTNEDRRLSTEDAVDLFASDYNGSNLRQIGKNIYSYQLINNSTVLFSEVIDAKEIFKTWNTQSNKIETIKTIDEIPDAKAFNQIFY